MKNRYIWASMHHKFAGVSCQSTETWRECYFCSWHRTFSSSHFMLAGTLESNSMRVQVAWIQFTMNLRRCKWVYCRKYRTEACKIGVVTLNSQVPYSVCRWFCDIFGILARFCWKHLVRDQNIIHPMLLSISRTFLSQKNDESSNIWAWKVLASVSRTVILLLIGC